MLGARARVVTHGQGPERVTAPPVLAQLRPQRAQHCALVGLRFDVDEVDDDDAADVAQSELARRADGGLEVGAEDRLLLVLSCP